ncbi:TIGR04283 family arsenosugar biosynthesis glycosyltransferase [Rubinisphaera sp.]|uniref:TIGR04283 family arsenosugar biosynthesis glycosyltransferase n=1 Tax=Rubinisphaera sp. TaxID=2024857 RepID=UPI000C1007DD|nr:TIGR04283 family arsenosugar biosynthesis glycosyltransferase [Rubinisphaera sp.]MBV11572.1 glycosyltransferase [Rubinisphaera sp.]|tara:strand:- start:472 stop:1161 length:690 start_codon:yes stop_codon:yes gene_type:complete
MDISIVIPALNEAERIGRLIETLQNLPDFEELECEIIVIDGGSQDETTEAATNADLVLISPRGRAIQLNTGAEQASGEILLFLHADCELTTGALLDAKSQLEKPGVIAGCYSQQIDAASHRYRMMEWGNRQRVRWLGWSYGDQGLYLRRDIFNSLGGFPQEPFLEDLIFSKRLKKLGRIAVSRQKIIVSPRRWQKKGLLRQTIRNWTIITLAHCGVSPTRLAKMYSSVR